MPAERAARNSAPLPSFYKELPHFPTEEERDDETSREASPYADVYAVAERYLDSPKNSRSRQWRDMTDGFLRDAAMEAQSRRILGEAAISFIRRRAIDKVAAYAQSFRSLRTEAAGRDEDRRADTYRRMERDRAAMRNARIVAKGLSPQAVIDIEARVGAEAERILAEEERGARLAGRSPSIEEQQRLYDAAYHQAYIVELERFADRERKAPLDRNSRKTPEYQAEILRRRWDPETGREIVLDEDILETTEDSSRGEIWREIASLEEKRRDLLDGFDIPVDDALNSELFPDEDPKLQEPSYQSAIVDRIEDAAETEREYLHRAYLGLRGRKELNGVAGHDLALLDRAAARLASIENALDERQQALERSERRPSPSISGIREAGTLASREMSPSMQEEPEDALAETRIHHPRLVEAGTEEQSVDRLRQQLRDRRMTAFLEDPKASLANIPSRQEAYAELLSQGWLEGTESVDEIQDLVDRYRNAIAAPQTIGRREPLPHFPLAAE